MLLHSFVEYSRQKETVNITVLLLSSQVGNWVHPLWRAANHDFTVCEIESCNLINCLIIRPDSHTPVYILPFFDFGHISSLKAVVLSRKLKLLFANIITMTDDVSDTCYTYNN